MAAPITGRNAHFVLDNAAGTPTDISSYVQSITPAVNREEFEYRRFKGTRTEKVAGFVTEDWDIRGAWEPAADTYWRALAGEDEGEGVDYILGPEGSDAGQVKYTGTMNVLAYEHDEISTEGIMFYTARVSVLSKTVSTF